MASLLNVDTSQTPQSSEHHRHPWLRGGRPLLWWAVFVLMLYGYRLHERLAAETRLTFAIKLQDRAVNYEAATTLDGQPFSSNRQLRIGWHKLVVTHPLADTASTNLFIWYGPHNLGEIVLKRQEGTLAIITRRSTERLTIRGPDFTRTMTNSSGLTMTAPTGRYQINAEYRHSKESQSIQVTPNQLTTCSLTPHVGSMEVTCNQEGATFEVRPEDGHWVEYGKLPGQVVDLPEGKYKLVALHRDNLQEQEVSIRDDATTTVKIEFGYGSAVLETEPAGATVMTDGGRSLGVTPLNLSELRNGRWNFLFRRNGYEDLPVVLDIAINQTTTIHTNLLNSIYVNSMKSARRYLQEADYDRASTAIGEALRVQAGDPDATALEKETAQQRTAYEAKKRRERFERLVGDIDGEIVRGEGENAFRDFIEAKKLFPDDPKIAGLQVRMAPAIRDHTWWAANQTLIKDSPYCATGVVNYGLDLTAARAGVGKAVGEALSFWKLKAERKMDEPTIMMELAARGLDQQRACILMLSEVGKSQVEIRYRLCMYVTNDGKTGGISIGPIAITTGVIADPTAMRRNLEIAVQDLRDSLKRQLEANPNK